jgi:hypothetical protein
VFFVLSDGALWSSTWHSGGGWQTFPIKGTAGTGVPGGPVSAVARQPTTLDVVYEASNGGYAGGLIWAWWNSHQSQSNPWTLSTIPMETVYPPAQTIGSSAVSLVAPTSYSMQVFYLSPLHQLGTATWTDPGECNEQSLNGCSSSPSSTPWVGAGGIGWLIGAP